MPGCVAFSPPHYEVLHASGLPFAASFTAGFRAAVGMDPATPLITRFAQLAFDSVTHGSCR